MHALAAALLFLLLVTGATAQGEALTGDSLTQALTSNDAQVRRDAAARLGEVGTMANVALLVRSLRDPDADTRERAEQSLWRIWARSGDPEIDKLYQTGIEQ